MPHLRHVHGHHGWDRSRPPLVEVAPGTVLQVELADCFDGQLGPEATAPDVAALDLSVANPLTGPIAVAGAQPGDALTVEILRVNIGEVGWTALLPGFGLLADDFPDPHVVVSRITNGRVLVGDLAVLPARPFLGTVGVVPAAPGTHSVIPPRNVGGNLDCREVRPGATLVLPVEVPGALLSLGDPHAAQGDGEVCGTAVETTAVAEIRVDVRPGGAPPAPHLDLPAEGTVPVGPRLVTMGVGPDLHGCARDATRSMIDRLGELGVSPADAYVLCSVAAHLRIAEVVDAPNWVVTCEFDRSLLV